MADLSPTKTSVHEERVYRIRILGTGAADPTVEVGQGVTVAETATGVYEITWAKGPGTFIGWSCSFGAATPADLKGYTAVRDTYDTTNFVLAISVFDSSNAAADLAANQYADITVVFAETSSP